MKAKTLVSLAIPMMLLGGCGADKVEKKADTKVESKEEIVKIKVSKEEYPKRMMDLDYTFEYRISEMTELAVKSQDRNNDVHKVNKELEETVKDVLKSLDAFYTVEPPKEFEEAHKTVLKAVDCYKEAIETNTKLAKTNSVTKESRQKMKETMSKGNDYLKKGFEPIKKAYAETQPKKLETVFLQDSKELVGVWGKNTTNGFSKTMEFKEDGTYTVYDDTNHTSYEQNHLNGTWSCDVATKKLNMTFTEYVKDGEKLDKSEVNDSVVYTVMHFLDGKMNLQDDKGTRVEVEKKK
ncbi:protein of unknown function [Bacillus sp. 491mf]|uniref:DUF3994 domain-containing protein n=1 Tax=Bacillus sp. 491mf TaxID=1761755 RepID=UPI0008EB7C1C|nr:DUF3994 domain-containing protein [Bacillus sp. 491mf]SFC75778.1 protein of unknown function [Bacillus sp. 491mf]